jgi:choline dehydrogenase-like flavoprotein
VGADWPIGYAELEPWYGEAEHELGVAGNADTAAAGSRSAPFPMPTNTILPALQHRFTQIGVQLSSQPAAITTRAWQGRPPRSAYRAQRVHLPRALATGRCQLVTDATVVRLETDDTRRVVRAIYAGVQDRTEKSAEGRLFILGCGGVEVARLLRLSASGRHPDGLANSSGLVGSFFMDHHRTDVVCQFEKPLSLPFFRALSFQYNSRPAGTPDIGLLLTFKASPTPEDLIRQYYWGSQLRERILSDTTTELLIG